MQQVSRVEGKMVDFLEKQAWEKCYCAVLILATGEQPLRERIAEAYSHELAQLKLPGLPWADLQICYDDICDDICPTGRNVSEVLGRWDDAEIGRIAKSIVALYEAVVRRLPT